MHKSKKKITKYEIFYLIILLISLIIMIAGAAMAYFSASVSQEENGTKIYSGTLVINYIDGIEVNNPKLFPRIAPTNVEDIENDSEINEQQAIEFEKRFTELKAQVNIIILKIDNITNLSQKSKDTKTNFFIQLMVIILSAIILGVVGFIWSHAWNSISYKLNSNTSSPNNIQSSIASTSD